MNEEIFAMGNDVSVSQLGRDFVLNTAKYRYTYHFESLGVPIIQLPQDMVAIQELIWSVKPDLIIETGVAHGGSLIMSAAMLALLDMSEAIARGTTFDPKMSSRRVLGIDIDIRENNKKIIESHPMSSRIQLIQGSSTAPEIVEKAHTIARKHDRVLVLLDSNHTHEHVLAELEAYAMLTSVGSYCVVFDTLIEDAPESMFPDRDWGQGNSPKTAVWEYLKKSENFVIDKNIEYKLLATVAPDGYLQRVK